MAEPQQPPTIHVTDDLGRKLEIRPLEALDLLDLFEAAGPNSDNDKWLAMGMRACSVRSIDGVPVSMPVKRDQVRALIAKLGMRGLSAASKALNAEEDEKTVTPDDVKEAAKN